MFKITVETKQFPTENPEKVATALTNLIEGKVQLKQFGEQKYYFIESTKPSSLEKLYELIRKQRILDVARKSLRKGIVGDATIFFVNKQVAFANKLNFCDEVGESPLGPIRVEIQYDNIDHLIDWLTPYTRNGAEVKLVREFP